MKKVSFSTKCVVGEEVFVVTHTTPQGVPTQMSGPHKVIQMTATFGLAGELTGTGYKVEGGGFTMLSAGQVKTHAEMIAWHKQNSKKK